MWTYNWQSSESPVRFLQRILTKETSLKYNPVSAATELVHVHMINSAWYETVFNPNSVNFIQKEDEVVQCKYTKCKVTRGGPDDIIAQTQAHVLLAGDWNTAKRLRFDKKQKLAYMSMEAFHFPPEFKFDNWDYVLSYHGRWLNDPHDDKRIHLTYREQRHKFFTLFAYNTSKIPFEERLDAVWVSSSPVGIRNNIVMDLIDAGLDVYSFGSCLHQERTDTMFTHCKNSQPNGELLSIAEQKKCLYPHFKFVVAIENTWEPDYVTEKYWDSLESPLVMIYKGALNIQERYQLANHSFVNIDDFETVRDVVKFVKQMSEPEWQRYQDWKKVNQSSSAVDMRRNEYTLEHSWEKFGCLICDHYFMHEFMAS